MLFADHTEKRKAKINWLFRNTKKNKGETIMALPEEFIRELLDKKVFVRTLTDGDTGTVSDIKDGWLKLIDKKDNVSLINIETIIRIAEVSKRKN